MVLFGMNLIIRMIRMFRFGIKIRIVRKLFNLMFWSCLMISVSLIYCKVKNRMGSSGLDFMKVVSGIVFWVKLVLLKLVVFYYVLKVIVIIV